MLQFLKPKNMGSLTSNLLVLKKKKSVFEPRQIYLLKWTKKKCTHLLRQKRYYSFFKIQLSAIFSSSKIYWFTCYLFINPHFISLYFSFTYSTLHLVVGLILKTLLSKHKTWKIHKSWSSDFFETDNSLITFSLIFFCKTHVFPLKMLKSNPKCLFSLKKFLIFYWFLRPSLASFLFRNFLNFLTFPAWLAYKMITYIKKYVYYTIRVSR